jgi:hypothetical protein
LEFGTSKATLTQFLAECSKDVKLITGGVRKMYTMTGQRIKSLDEIEDNTMYVASAGDPFRNVEYMTEESHLPVFNGYSKSNLTILQDALPLRRRKINRSTGGLLLDGTMEVKRTENISNPFISNVPYFYLEQSVQSCSI